jgi:hypothetical protein
MVRLNAHFDMTADVTVSGIPSIFRRASFSTCSCSRSFAKQAFRWLSSFCAGWLPPPALLQRDGQSTPPMPVFALRHAFMQACFSAELSFAGMSTTAIDSHVWRFFSNVFSASARLLRESDFAVFGVCSSRTLNDAESFSSLRTTSPMVTSRTTTLVRSVIALSPGAARRTTRLSFVASSPGRPLRTDSSSATSRAPGAAPVSARTTTLRRKRSLFAGRPSTK